MKKLLVLSFAVLSFLVGVKTTYAMTEQELKTKLSKTYTINGAEFKVDSDNLVLLQRYLDAYDVSSADAQYIADRVDEAVAIIQRSGKTNINDLSASTKNELKALVEKVSANTSVKATVTKGSIVIYKPDGSGVFAEVTKLVKQTGNNVDSMAIVAGVSFAIVLAGASFVVVRRLKFAHNAYMKKD